MEGQLAEELLLEVQLELAQDGNSSTTSTSSFSEPILFREVVDLLQSDWFIFSYVG